MGSRDRIIEVLRTATKSNGGEPPSRGVFFKIAEINARDLIRAGWANYGDLLQSEGFERKHFKEFKKALTDEQLFEPLAKLIRAAGHFPSQNEREVERGRNPDFPGTGAYFRRAGGEHLQTAFLRWCEDNDVHQDLAKILATDQVSSAPPKPSQPSQIKGYVYMLRSGRLCKIGRETTAGARQADAGTWLANPKVVHRIATVDPEGVEAYWHERFRKQGKHVKGELFNLTASDMAEFKRWKKIA